MKLVKRHLSSFQIIIIGFALVILLGAFILMLPVCSKDCVFTSFGDAIFTATSAVCVTGLVVKDTATYWSDFGQFVILCLIQIGGLGIITAVASFSMLSGKKIGLMQRSTMQNAISAHKLGGIVRLTGFILKTTFIIELLGALAMMPQFIKDFGARGIWMAFFHSVSAFCNAGFDLMGVKGAFSSLTSYTDNILINSVIMVLITVGGIGFLVWDDIKAHKLRFKGYSAQTKLVIVTSFFLIILPALYYFFFEYFDYGFKKRVLSSLFQSVTHRTAGFNTEDLSKMSPVGKLISIFLMLTGGSPGSTAGGLKTTTLALVLISAFSVFKKKENAECFGRRIDDVNIKNASAVFIMYLVLFVAASCIIYQIEEFKFSECLFEVASAIGTVGLTYGITTKLGGISRIIIMFLMFFGRVGGLTIIYAAFSPRNQNISKKPVENITVG